MRAIGLLSYLLFFTATVFGQGYNPDEVKAIKSLEEAQEYVASHSGIYLTFLCSGSKDEEYLKRMKSLEPGDTYSTQYFDVHIVSEGKKKMYRFNVLTLVSQLNPNAARDAEKALDELNNGTPFNEVSQKYSDDPAFRAGDTGDHGWVDLDYFVESFQEDLRKHKKGDKFISRDENNAWYNVVEITESPKKFNGHYALFYGGAISPASVSDKNHGEVISTLETEGELIEYAKKNEDEVFLNLINEISDVRQYELITEAKKNTEENEPVVIEREDQDYRFVKDTSVQLYSIQYIYIDGTNLGKEEKNARINEIYNKFHAGTPFNDLVSEYWPDNRGMSTMRNVEGTLLAEDLLAKVKTTNVGELFVARVGQSYFIGVPLEEPQTANAYLLITYPHND